MRSAVTLLFLSTCLFVHSQRETGNLVFENVPDIPQELSEQMVRYQNTRPAACLGWSPEGAILISTRFGESNQLHTIAEPMAMRRQLTFFKEPITYGSYCPDKTNNGFLFLKDAGGNEFSQLYWYDLNSGRHRLLSDGGRTQNGAGLWSNAGDQFVYTSTRRNGKDYDLYLVYMQKPQESKLVAELNGSWSALDWSPDDKKILLRQYFSINHSRLYLLDLSTGTREELMSSEQPVSYGDSKFTADGKGLFIVSDDASEFRTLKQMDIASRRMKPITHSMNWDVSDVVINKKRDRLVFRINSNGIDELYEMDCATMKYVLIPGIPEGVITGMYFNTKGNELAFALSNAQIPGDVFSVSFPGKLIRRWTEGETGGLDTGKFPAAELITYETFDQANGGQRRIPAFVYRTAHTNLRKKPVLIIIHGGPEGQARPSFSSFVSYLNNELGIIVIQPNVRGSSGYGKTYLQMDNGFKREESVQDIGMLLNWIAKQPDMDSSRVAVMGGSYGGYMSLASMTNYNARLRCGIDVVGISNFVTFLKNTEEYRRDLRRVEYGDERDPKMNEFLEKISPLSNVQKITKPMLIVQGANDPRVPLSEAEQMKKKLQEKGNETWYLLAKDEGHGFRKKTNVDYYQWTVVMFLKRYLLAN